MSCSDGKKASDAKGGEGFRCMISFVFPTDFEVALRVDYIYGLELAAMGLLLRIFLVSSPPKVSNIIFASGHRALRPLLHQISRHASDTQHSLRSIALTRSSVNTVSESIYVNPPPLDISLCACLKRCMGGSGKPSAPDATWCSLGADMHRHTCSRRICNRQLGVSNKSDI